MSDEERTMEQGAKRLLDGAARNLDAQTLTRLRHARAEAWRRAEEANRDRTPGRAAWWLPVGAVAAGLALGVAVALWMAQPRHLPVLAAEDLELLAAGEGPEFYADLEFYQWVALHEAG
ncbi:hypothetical protein SVA_2808 [Sulfurifustis variabilis]|uniref:DUF3619 family protein n=1 Tax=Sulfurifustis variabilis TaxID=1675686 RepID=A0A1B4V743_9GAMM|nr:hypothetical protein [Sulfurifustis variabilis]BAU49356.1 hypothetical protein SVA_2808 [Sulfurifustis variabilis]